MTKKPKTRTKWLYVKRRDDWDQIQGEARELMLYIFRVVFIPGPTAKEWTDDRFLQACGYAIDQGIIEIRFRWIKGDLKIESRLSPDCDPEVASWMEDKMVAAGTLH